MEVASALAAKVKGVTNDFAAVTFEPAAMSAA